MTFIFIVHINDQYINTVNGVAGFFPFLTFFTSRIFIVFKFEVGKHKCSLVFCVLAINPIFIILKITSTTLAFSVINRTQFVVHKVGQMQIYWLFLFPQHNFCNKYHLFGILKWRLKIAVILTEYIMKFFSFSINKYLKNFSLSSKWISLR